MHMQSCCFALSSCCLFVIIIIIIIIIITLFNEGKEIDYWSPSSFHNGPPTIKVIKCID